MFEIRNVTKKYKDEFALQNISMKIGKGMNFIIGASGSGKTTLLKIITGMEHDYEGDVCYLGENIKSMSKQEKSYLYNHTFGFIWQDFNLLEDFTVTENITLPLYLQGGINQKMLKKTLQDLKISELADQKVKTLSGGQKQRVAIARELMKNPKVIIADEPTSALDERATKEIIAILRNIAKSHMVIIVTHDTSLIDHNSKVYELDKGELIACEEPITEQYNRKQEQTKETHTLTPVKAHSLAFLNQKRKCGNFIISALVFLISSILLLTALSGVITDSTDTAFLELYETYGKSILDIDLVGSFMSAGATAGESDSPNANVNQDISGLYDRFLTDERIEHIVSTQAFHNIKLTVDDTTYEIQTSNSVPVVNELTAGVMPMGDKNEIVVPDSFVKKLGVKDKDVLGKNVSFEGAIYNWDSGEPVLMPVRTDAVIVGVVNTTVKYEYEGQIMEYSVDDSFFFSQAALTDMRNQAEITKGSSSFSMRTKSPSDLIAMKDELNADGIVPLGRFELVEDMVRLNQQSTKQSGLATIIISFLSVAAVGAIALLTSCMRKKDFAIYTITGFSKNHCSTLFAAEQLLAILGSILLLLIGSPIINFITKKYWSQNILTPHMLILSTLFIVAMGILSWIITTIISSTTNISNTLKTGEH